jgi:hypothetical protein
VKREKQKQSLRETKEKKERGVKEEKGLREEQNCIEGKIADGREKCRTKNQEGQDEKGETK